jgi:cardiolipin synthase
MQNEVSEFTRELVDELARNHYSLRAWQTFLARSWDRSLEDIRECPARTRSTWWWVAAVAAMGFSIILLTLWKQTPGQAFMALLLWVPWYAGAVFFILTHLGMVDNDDGLPHQSLLLPNGLSFARIALAPLVVWPCLQVAVHPVTGPVFAFFLAALTVSDLLDGWLARRLDICTRLGRMLDVLADMALLTFLAVGLYLAGIIPGLLLSMLIVRYPVLLIVVLVLSFTQGPASMRPTLIGKATTFAVSVVLLAVTFQKLLAAPWPTPLLIEWSIWSLYLLIGANILYLFYRGATWAGHIRSQIR